MKNSLSKAYESRNSHDCDDGQLSIFGQCSDYENDLNEVEGFNQLFIHNGLIYDTIICPDVYSGGDLPYFKGSIKNSLAEWSERVLGTKDVFVSSDRGGEHVKGLVNHLGGGYSFSRNTRFSFTAVDKTSGEKQACPILVGEMATSHVNLHLAFCVAAAWLNGSTQVQYVVLTKSYQTWYRDKDKEEGVRIRTYLLGRNEAALQRIKERALECITLAIDDQFPGDIRKIEETYGVKVLFQASGEMGTTFPEDLKLEVDLKEVLSSAGYDIPEDSLCEIPIGKELERFCKPSVFKRIQDELDHHYFHRNCTGTDLLSLGRYSSYKADICGQDQCCPVFVHQDVLYLTPWCSSRRDELLRRSLPMDIGDALNEWGRKTYDLPEKQRRRGPIRNLGRSSVYDTLTNYLGDINDLCTREPDFCFYWDDKEKGPWQKFPCLVGEAAAKHETLHVGFIQAASWLNDVTTTKYVVLMKFWDEMECKDVHMYLLGRNEPAAERIKKDCLARANGDTSITALPIEAELPGSIEEIEEAYGVKVCQKLIIKDGESLPEDLSLELDMRELANDSAYKLPDDGQEYIFRFPMTEAFEEWSKRIAWYGEGCTHLMGCHQDQAKIEVTSADIVGMIQHVLKVS